MNLILALVQVFSGTFIIGVFISFFPLGFGNSYVHPEDAKRPFKLQRIRIRDLGEDSDYVPREQVWAGLFSVAVMAIVWLAIYHYFGLFMFR